MRLTTENTAIVLDSTADAPAEVAGHPNWRMVPLYVRFGDESYRDHVELDAASFYVRLRGSEVMPTTSQPTPGDFLAAYEELAAYERVYSLHLSSRFSGTWESARLAAQQAGPDRVRVVDTASASVGIAMLALALQRRLAQGTSDEEIEAVVADYVTSVGLRFTVDTLEFLARGGRIGRAAAWAGELLNLKPILTIADGEIVPLKKVRGSRKAFLEFQRAFTEGTEDSPSLRVGIAHADAPERMEALSRMVADLRPRAQVEVQAMLGPVVGAHTGPGTVGFFWWTVEG